MNYSLRELRAYLGAIERLESERAAHELQLGFMGAQGRSKDVVKLVRDLQQR